MKTTKGIIIYGTFMIAVFILNFKLIFTSTVNDFKPSVVI